MANLSQQYRATADDMGDWGGDEQEAATCWNHYVAPALLAIYDREEAAGADADAIIGNIQSLAWDQFCDTTDEETWDELGQRVAAFINR